MAPIDDGPNTALAYMYRDASNYKQTEEVVFAGRISQEEFAAIMGAREGGEWFIPSQVGLLDLQERWGRLYEDDHVWHELDQDGIWTTSARPTEHVDIHEFARAFAAAQWDVDAAMRAVGITA